MLFAQTPCWLVALPGSGLYRADSVFPRTFQRPGQAARIAGAMGGRVLAWDEVYPTAVNLCDLSDLDRASAINPVSILLHGFCDEASPTVQTDKKLIDTYAVILDGPAAQDEERLDALVDVLQTIIGPRKLGRRVRCYQQGPRGDWSEIRP